MSGGWNGLGKLRQRTAGVAMKGGENIFRRLVNGGGGMARFADQGIYEGTWLPPVAQGWPVFLQGSSFVGQPIHQAGDFDEGRLPERSAKRWHAS